MISICKVKCVVLAIIIILSNSVILSSCLDFPAPSRDKYLKEMTVIVYMIADNDFDYFSDRDINELEEVGSNPNIDIIVVRDRLDSSEPKGVNVYRIAKDENPNKIISPIVATYQELDSCNKDNLRSIIKTIQTLFPSRSYALFLWSHGSGAVPKRYKPLWFGEDYSHNTRCDIIDLSEALSEFRFEFIAFDGCSMADVEIINYFLGIMKYLILSQTEILAEGYPYNRVVRHLASGRVNEETLKSICSEYVRYYKNKDDEVRRSASISLVSVGGIEYFARSVSNYISLIYGYLTNGEVYSAMSNSQRVSYVYNFKRDLMDFLERLKNSLGNVSNDVIENVYEDLRLSWSKIVLWEGHTDKYLGGISLSNLRGLNIFLPLTRETNLIEYYRGLWWYTNSGINLIY